MKKTLIIMAMAVACVFVFMAGSSQASFIGYIYQGASTAAQTPSLGPGSATLTDTFTVDSLMFDSRITGINVDQFLSGGSGNPNNLQGLDGSLFSVPIVTSPGIGTFFQFTGTAYFPTNTVITHDDGFWLDLGGTIIDKSTPVSPTLTELHNEAGTYAFTLNYGAWNGIPEVLQVPNVEPVPEPGTMMLLGSGLVGLAGWGRKKFRK